MKTQPQAASQLAGDDSGTAMPAAHRHYLIALGVWMLATGPAWWTMAEEWWVDPNYSHGLLIIPVALFFLWRERSEWQAVEPKTSALGLALFAGCALLYLVGTAAAENFSVRTTAVAGVGTLAWGILGWQFIRTAWFPFAFLFFAVPWPYVIYYQVTFPMQLFSTKVACGALDFFGITFVRQGNIIHLPGHSLEVVEACSGVRSLLSLTTLGAAYAYLTQPGYIRPWLLFALSVPIALGANVFRLVITAVGAYAWDPKIAEEFLHEISGVLVFSTALAALFIAGSLISWLHRKSPPVSP
jgi:exosortase